MPRFSSSGLAVLVLLMTTRAAPAPLEAAPRPAAPAPTATTAPAEEARVHYARGVSLYSQRAYAAALAEFRRAHALVANPKLLFSMGQAHAGLGQYARAIEVLAAYVEHVGDTVPAERRQQIERQLEAFRARVGKLDVSVNVAHATITVDGAAVGTSPLRAPLVLDPGPHRIAASRTTFTSATARVSVVAAETTPLHLALSAPPRAQTPELSAPLWIATGACAALALGSGIVTLLQRKNYDRELERGHDGDADSIQRDLQQQRSQLQHWLLATDVLLGATAATGAAAIYVRVRESDDRENLGSARSVDVAAGVRGRF